MSPAQHSGERAVETGQVSRRRLLAGGAAACLASTAGCLGGGGGGDGADTGDNGTVPEDIDPDRVLGDVVLNTAFPVQLVEVGTDEVLTDIHHHPDSGVQHWHETPVSVPVGERRSVVVRVTDTDGETVPLGADSTLRVVVEPTADTSANLVDVTVDGDVLEFRGTSRGDGALAFRLHADSGDAWEAPPLPVRVE